MQHAMATASTTSNNSNELKTSTDSNVNDGSTSSSSSSQTHANNSDSTADKCCANGYIRSNLRTAFMTDNSDSDDDDDESEVDSFLMDQGEYEDTTILDTKFLLPPEMDNSDCTPCTDLRNVDPVTQAKLAALLEAAGLGKFSAGVDGKQYTDPEVLRKLTSSVSCALDEAAAALNRMRAENSGHIPHSSEGRSLAEACSDGDVKAVRMMLDEGRSSVHETTEEGESLLSFACSSGYFELAHILLSKKANVDDRGIKGDCTPLMGAASGGHVDIVKLLIAHGADVNALSQSGNTSLMCACAGGHEEVVTVLLESGANVEDHNENGHTPLMEAASAGHVPVAKILLDHGAGINTHSNEFKESALTLACYKGHLEMVRFLLEAGADQEHKTDEMHTALMEASMDGHVEVARLLLDSGAQVNMPADSFESPLTLAACGGHVELAMLLLERGANIEEVNDEGYTPLMEASREGHEEMVALLLSQDADINAQTEETQETALTLACCGGFLEVADFLIKAGANIELGASSPLMEAAQEGHSELVRYLIEAGSNVNAPTATGDTALTYACENGHTDVADLLLQACAHLEHESEGGRTPLMKATRSGHLCTVQFLISRGADINRCTTNNDHTPLSLACAGGHLAVVELLLAHGADPTHKLKDNSTMLIEAAKGGHTNVVQLLLDYPNSMISSPPPPPLPPSSCGPQPTSSSTHHTAEPPRVPPHGLQLVQSDLHAIQPGLMDPVHLLQQQPPQQLPGAVGLGAANIRASLPIQRPVVRNNTALNNNNNEAMPATGGAVPVPATNNILKQDAALMTPQLVQLIKNCQQQAAMVNVASELSYDFEKSLVEGVSNAAAVAAAGMGLDLAMTEVDDSCDVRPSVRLEACINSMMKKAEMMHHNREEQILQKQQILEELQRVERELQEKAQAQILLNAQYRLDQIQQNLLPSSSSSAPRDEALIPSNPEAILDYHLSTFFNDKAKIQRPNFGNITDAESGGTGDNVPQLDASLCEEALKKKLAEASMVSTHTVTTASATKNMKSCDAVTEAVASTTAAASSASVSKTKSKNKANIAKNIGIDPPVAAAPTGAVGQNRIAGQYNCLNEQQQQQQQAAMALAAHTYMPQSTSTSCNVGTQCMVDPCLIEHSQIQDSPSIPLPFLASSNQSPSSPQPSIDIAKFDIDSQTDSNHDTALTLACAGGHEELVTLLLQRGANIEHRDKKGFTPLILAGTAGHAGVVEILLSNMADIEAQSERTKDTPLSLACSGGRYEVVEILLAHGANKEHRNVSDYTPLSLAASGGYVNIIKLLLNHGAEINSRTGSKLGISPLMLAAMNGHTAAVKLLLDMGSDINAQIETNRNTALTLACFQGRHEVVSLLVDRKANIEHRAKTGLTPLMEAASGGYAEVGCVLLDKGADVNAPPVPSSRDTALTIAADKGHYRFIGLLLSRGAAVDVKNKKGNSPLWLACNDGHLDVVQLLVSVGADIDSQDNRKVSCLMAAFRKGHVKVVKWMVKHVTQFPSDQECTRYVATISDTDLLKRCQQCMEIIQTAKDRQEAEANKNASILLEELDMEKSREESKKAAAARRRERKRLKRKEKQATKDPTPEEQNENIKNEKKNRVATVTSAPSTVDECVIKTPLLPPGVTLTPINPGECLAPKREEKNTVSIMKIETTTSCSEPMVTNMGTVIVVETKSSNVSLTDQTSSTKSQSMITISRINSNTVTVSSSHPQTKSAVSITSSSSSKAVNKPIPKNNKIEPLKPDKPKEQNKKQQIKQANKENKPAKTKSQVIVAVSCSATTSTTSTLTAASSRLVSSAPKTTLSVSNKNSSSKKKDDKVAKKKEDGAPTVAINNDLVIEPLATTGIGDLDDFGALPESKKNSKSTSKSMANISTLNAFSKLPLDVHELEGDPCSPAALRSPNSLVVNSMRSAIAHSPNSSSSPKKGQKKEDGWKEVVRRSKKVSVPSSAISRVIGRAGCNINAIREVSGAHIEVEKQRGAADRTIMIRGSADSTRQAHQLITALIKDPDRELLELLSKTASDTSASKSESRIIATATSKIQKISAAPSVAPVTSLSIYSTPAFAATSGTKQLRPAIPTSSLSSSPLPNCWPAFSSPMATNSSARKVLGGEVPKSPAARQLFPDASKIGANLPGPSVSKGLVSYTTAVLATAKNTKSVTTVSTSVSVHNYKATNQVPPRMSNQPISAFDNMTQFKAPLTQNGPLRAAVVNSNSSSGSSGSPIAQEYSPFNNSIFSQVAQQSVWNSQREGTKGMNFASVAAAGVVSLAPTNSTIGPLHQSSISSPSPNSSHDPPTEPVDVAKAPGYRAGGSHMSPGSNSTESGHYSAPNTPPIAPIGAPAHQSGQPSPAAPSPPVRPSSLPEQPLNCDLPHSVSSTSPISSLSVNNLAERVSALQVATSSAPAYIGSVPQQNTGILSVASLAPGGPVACHAPPVNVMNSMGNQPPRIPMHQQGMPPMQAQPMYPSRFMAPGSLQNVVFAQNAVNVSMASANNVIQSNLNPNAPDFSSRSNGSIMHANVQPRLQQPASYMDQHQSAFRPPVMHNQFQQQNTNASGAFMTQGSSRMAPFMAPPSGIPMDFITGLTPEAAAAALHALNVNRHQNVGAAREPGHLPNMTDGDQVQQQRHQSATPGSANGSDTSSGLNDDHRKSLPRPIGTERAHRKTPVFAGVSDVKGIWSFNNSGPSGTNWMSSSTMDNNGETKMSSTGHMLANGNVITPDYRLPDAAAAPPLDPLYHAGANHVMNNASGAYVKNMMGIVNQHMYNNNTHNGPSAPPVNDFWAAAAAAASAKLPLSSATASSAAVLQPDQKQMWNNSEWNSQPKV